MARERFAERFLPLGTGFGFGRGHEWPYFAHSWRLACFNCGRKAHRAAERSDRLAEARRADREAEKRTLKSALWACLAGCVAGTCERRMA